MSKTIFYLIALSILALALAACAGSTGAGAALDDTSWTLVEVNGQGPASRATLRFDSVEGSASGSNGCNSYSGSYSLTGGKLQFGELVQTLIGCEEAVAQQEQTFMRVLANLSGYTLENNLLTLHTEEEMLVFKQGWGE